MSSNTAKIYYLPPLATRVKQISRAQQLLESRGFKVKVVESRQLSPGDRRALEQGGLPFPVAFLLGKFIVCSCVHIGDHPTLHSGASLPPSTST